MLWCTIFFFMWFFSSPWNKYLQLRTRWIWYWHHDHESLIKMWNTWISKLNKYSNGLSADIQKLLAEAFYCNLLKALIYSYNARKPNRCLLFSVVGSGELRACLHWPLGVLPHASRRLSQWSLSLAPPTPPHASWQLSAVAGGWQDHGHFPHAPPAGYATAWPGKGSFKERDPRALPLQLPPQAR